MEFPIFNPNLTPLSLKKVKSNFEYFINVLNRLETIKKKLKMVEFYKPGKIRQKQICFYFFMVIIKMPLKCGSFSKLVNCIRIHIIYNW